MGSKRRASFRCAPWLLDVWLDSRIFAGSWGSAAACRTIPIATRRLDLGAARGYAENDALAWRGNCGVALDSKI